MKSEQMIWWCQVRDADLSNGKYEENIPLIVALGSFLLDKFSEELNLGDQKGINVTGILSRLLKPDVT